VIDDPLKQTPFCELDRDNVVNRREQEIEGIYAESQYKIENVPGYAEVFKRVKEIMTKFITIEYCPTEQELAEFDLAMGELMIIELSHYYGVTLRR
jgi:hypothetical protein